MVPEPEQDAVGTVQLGSKFGSTVIVYVIGAGAGEQPVAGEDTVMVETMAAPELLTAVKVGVFPLPDAANPMVVLEFVHVKVPPAGVVEKLDAGTDPPLQVVIFATGFMTGEPPPPGVAGTIQSSNAMREPADAPLCVRVMEFVPPGTLMVAILPVLEFRLQSRPVPPLMSEKPEEQ